MFCELGPAAYAISEKKEILKRHLQNLTSKETFAKTLSQERLPNVVSAKTSHLIKRAPGIDPILQQNKAVNIRLACEKLNGLILHPGETFSFWVLVGKTSRRRGYMAGRVLVMKKLIAGLGGGLCNLSNTIHLLVLHSPLEVTEFHAHSDALAPDEGVRVPFSSGTAVGYNYIDYRFKNNTDQDVQLCLWCEDETLFAELRSERPFPNTYKLTEEGHHFQKEGEKYYRVSKIYKNTVSPDGEVIDKKLVLDNHSEVMFDYSLIPQEQITV